MSSTGSAGAAGPSLARRPAGVVLVGGAQVPWTEWAVTSNGFFRADTFSVSLPASGLPAGLRLADLAGMDAISVEVRASTDGEAPTSLILGQADELEAVWQDGLVTLSGRDHTADFLEAKTAETFLNQTASQIVQTLAGRHGLAASVTATTTRAGKYYEIDHDKLTDQTTEWDLITYLAQKEDYAAWVSGTTLNFQPAATAAGTPVTVRWSPPGAGAVGSGPFVSLKTRRNLSLASDVTVIVRSWNHKQKTPFKAVATGVKSGAGTASASPQTYAYRMPGLTYAQALQYARSKLETVTRHERTIALEMAPDVTTTPRGQIQLAGTGTAFDQLYWIDEIERRMSWNEFTQSLTAKNHSPQTTEA